MWQPWIIAPGPITASSSMTRLTINPGPFGKNIFDLPNGPGCYGLLSCQPEHRGDR